MDLPDVEEKTQLLVRGKSAVTFVHYVSLDQDIILSFTIHYSAVLNATYNTFQDSKVRYNIVCSTYIKVKYGTVQYSTLQYKTLKYVIVQHSTNHLPVAKNTGNLGVFPRSLVSSKCFPLLQGPDSRSTRKWSRGRLDSMSWSP